MSITKVRPSKTRIGWIGTGVMGSAMCSHIVKKGYKTTVYNRTKRKTRDLVKQGAEWVASPAVVAENSDIVFTIVGFPVDVREVYMGEKGILTTIKPGSIVVDMTTTEPALSKEIYDRAKDLGVQAIDAPVSGGDIGAQAGTLSIMVGGDDEAVRSVMPLLKLMGKNIVHQGGPGAGQHAKMCNQIMAAGIMSGMCETLLYGYKSGLDLVTMLKSVSKGAAGCWMLDNLAPRVIKRDFNPGFFVEHFIKDMGIALKEAESMNIVLPGLTIVRDLYVATKAQGHGRKGTQALLLALEQISGVKH